jgi:adenylate cyclase
MSQTPANYPERERARQGWLAYLTGNDDPLNQHARIRLLKRLPSDPRCKICGSPFRGIGRPFLPLFGMPYIKPSSMNPKICNLCDNFVRAHEVGAEVELTLLFADVRGSTALAERIGPTEFQRLIDRFFRAATEVLVESDALVDKLVGDEVIALYVPGIAGDKHPQRAVEAARALLAVTGHGSEQGAWLPVGVGVLTGIAWVSAVGSSQSVSQVTVLGDAANTAARLASAAGPGEVLVTLETWRRIDLDDAEFESRTLELRGKEEPVTVKVIRAESASGVE